MNTEKISIVYTTIATLQEAETLAEQAVVKKYAACVNIIPGALSVYEWEGKLEKTQECLLFFKTTMTKAEELKQWILVQHSYSIPAILSSTMETSSDFYTYVNSKIL